MIQVNILAIDQGTTGSAAAVMDSRGAVKSKVKREYRQIFPKPGWVEHDPEDIWGSVLDAVRLALERAQVSGKDIAAVGITNQRETTVLWERRTGRPVHNAIVWQDRRTADFCAKLKSSGHEKKFRAKTGLLLDPYFSGTKIRWLLDRISKKNLAFGTVDSFLLWRLTGGKVHATDVSNASRTLLMDLKTLAWDQELCRILGVPLSILPEIRPSIGLFGHTKGVPGLPDGIPITGIAGDQQAALFGQACFEAGEAKCTFGTGSFLLMNIGPQPVLSRSGCLTTVAWQWKGKTTYALEGSAFICGAAVQWLRDGLGIIKNSSEVEALARSVPDAGGVEFVPALTGLGAPHWNPRARGMISGLTRGATKAHLARATLEGMALQNAELLSAMQKDVGRRIKSLKVDGGASADDLLMQLQADYLGAVCVRPRVIETTSAGAAFMAGLGAGIWKDFKDVRRVWKKEREFRPAMPGRARAERLRRWQEAVARASFILFFAAVAIGLPAAWAKPAEKPVIYPFLGSVAQGKVRVQVLNDAPGAAPKKIKAIYVNDPWESEEPAPKMFAAVLEKKTAVKEERAYLIYRPVKTDRVLENGSVLIFAPDQALVVSKKNTAILYKDPRSDISWKYRYEISREGVHEIIQEHRGGKCVRSIDYYTQANYDTGGDAEAEETERALCGTVYRAEEVQP